MKIPHRCGHHTGWMTISCIFFSLATANAQIDYSPAHIDHFVTRIMDSANVPGLSIAIIRDRKIQYGHGYGLTKADSAQKVNLTTIFDAASLSKPVFAYAVLQLVEEKRLDLDKPLYEYLPYPDAAADERYKKITARLVLSHRTGFPNWRQNRQAKQLTMVAIPGERYGYSGEGFVYLQKVVEHITDRPVNDLMQERVFKPLGMSHSSYVWQPTFETNFALPHDTFGQPETKGKPRQANVAYSLQTTAEDYAHFIVAILTAKGLKPATIDQMLTPQTQLPAASSRRDSLSGELFWGLGFGLEQTPTGSYFWHWGDNDTYKGYVTADRKQGNAVVYFANGFNGLGLAEVIVQHFVGGQHPALAFLGYDSYKAANSMFARHVLDEGVTAAIQPYLKNGKSTLLEGEMTWIGDQLLNRGHTAQALEVFRYNMEAYPDSATVYDRYAYANLITGDQAQAITFYNKLLAIKPDNTKVKQLLAGLADSQTGKGHTKLTLAGHPQAHLVTLAGSFNDWNPLRTFFVKNGDGWQCHLAVKPGTYTYKVVVDGQWMLDSANPATQTDEYGNTNSVLIIH